MIKAQVGGNLVIILLTTLLILGSLNTKWSSFVEIPMGEKDKSYITVVRKLGIMRGAGLHIPPYPSFHIYQNKEAHRFYIPYRWTSHRGVMSPPGTPGESICSTLPHKESESHQSFHRSATEQRAVGLKLNSSHQNSPGGSIKTQITGSLPLL